MVDAPEAWEFPKPGTEDEMAVRMVADPQENRPGSSEQEPSISGNDKAVLANAFSCAIHQSFRTYAQNVAHLGIFRVDLQEFYSKHMV